MIQIIWVQEEVVVIMESDHTRINDNKDKKNNLKKMKLIYQ